MQLKRVVVTGLGAVTPLGNSVNDYWNNLINGVSGAAPITRFDASKFKTRFACEVKGFNPEDYFDKKEARKLDAYSWYGIAASAQAVADSLASQLVDALKASGFNAVRAAKATPPQANDLVLQGQFVQIDQGSATQRFVIGFGVGATELRTQVQLFQVDADGWQPVKQFDTVAAGARFPGAAFFVGGGAIAGTAATSAVITSGVGAVREVRASIDADARRTSEQIASKLTELSTAQHWK